MRSFILLSFALLTVAFYLMSGGADFEPVSARLESPPPARTASPTPPPAQAPPAQTETRSDTLGVTRRSTNPDTLRAPAERDPAISAAEIDDAVEIALHEAPAADPVSAEPPAEPEIPTVLPGLISDDDFGATTIQSSVAVLRDVAASRVNVRGGPGTDFAVIGQLQRGDTVEIIGDSGTGWVLMRPLAGGPEGWLADFLLGNG